MINIPQQIPDDDGGNGYGDGDSDGVDGDNDNVDCFEEEAQIFMLLRCWQPYL